MSFSELFFVKNKTYNRKKAMVVFFCAVLLISALFGRLVYLMIFDAAHYQKLAKDLHERERKIKAARGEIVDRNGVVLATNRTVCTISVIHKRSGAGDCSSLSGTWGRGRKHPEKSRKSVFNGKN